MQKSFLICCLLGLIACGKPAENITPVSQAASSEITKAPQLSLAQANHLSSLPLKCMQKEYPNKLGQTLATEADLAGPKALHPAFYGCFDWHSAVHGHWMLVALLKRFPNLDQAAAIRAKLQQNISAAHIKNELLYFEKKQNKSYERTYGWAWLLKLSEELYTWDDPMAKTLHSNLEPLTQLIRDRYLEFLPKLYYPIRVGEHTNTGFGISFAWDYANTVGDTELLQLINQRAKEWYAKDKDCPLSWEPSGYDFLSPCLEEADIMRRVLEPQAFSAWLKEFLPQAFSDDFAWAPGQVTDRSDGKLVHLDGVNFSRAWVLYALAKSGAGNANQLRTIANQHMDFSLPNIVDGDYAGEHWLASFAVYALISAEDE